MTGLPFASKQFARFCRIKKVHVISTPKREYYSGTDLLTTERKIYSFSLGLVDIMKCDEKKK